jgi:signal transduction histidine kinase
MASEGAAGNHRGDDSSSGATEVSVLKKISSEINATLDRDELFDTVLRTLDELFGFDHCLILLLDETGESLEVVASRGYPDSALSTKVSLGSGLAGVVAKRRRMVRLGGLSQQRAYVSTIRREMEKTGRSNELGSAPSLPGLADVESQIGIPLMVKDALIGVLLIESAVKRAFSERDETLVSIVANQAASAIKSASLVRELTEAHGRLALLNETLEDRVRERTHELQRTNRELRDTQAQLLQTAKLVSLGDLVAGVAHEINTPLGAIRANADLARRAAVRISAALASAEQASSSQRDSGIPQALGALDEATKTTLVATQRISGIVASLRNFARLDESERKEADLHDGIESTLTLLHHKLDGRIDVLRRYGSLPKIVCYPNRLNQVFMNVLLNAIHAIDDRGTITISTRTEGDHVVIDFADSGRGIPAENLEKIFDPGFTTKGSGVGTGLGLAISYRIVQEHRGFMTAASEPGKGALLTVRVPTTR